MSQVPRPSRRRSVRVLLVVGLIAVLASACNQDNTPKSYSDQDNLVQTNFIEGCTGEGTSTTLAPTGACDCALAWIIANVPYDDANKKAPTTIPTANGDVSQTFDSNYSGPTFKAINSDLSKDPSKMPQDVQDGISSACASKGWKGSTGSNNSGGGGGPTTIG